MQSVFDISKLSKLIDADHEVLTADEFEKQVRETTERDIADDLAERRKRRTDAILGRAAIPPRFTGKTLDVFRADNETQRKILDECRDYAGKFQAVGGAKHTGASLILCGNPGTGKTHLAIGIAHQLLITGGTAVYATALQVIRQIRETWGGRSGKTESQVIADYVIPDLLIIDEVGVQFGTDAEKLHLFDLINARYEAMKPMIVISNLSLPEVEQFIGERAFDRLREGGGKAFYFNWDSLRSRIRGAV